jgi:transcriptional antiterminator RfaH
MTQKWYVLRTKPRSEKIVTNGLERDGFASYCPNVRTPIPNAKSTLTPLYPGYIFLRIEMESEGADLTSDRLGVLGWLRFGDTIPWVPDEVVANIRQRVRMINKDGGAWRHFRPGDRVQVVSGKLESIAEVIEEAVTTQGGQVRVLLDFMGRTVPAQVPWQDVRPIEAESVVANRPHRLPRRTRGRGRWIRGQKLLAVNTQAR